MEVVALAQQEPTHRVTHVSSPLDAFVTIAPSLQEKLESPDPNVRHGAESSAAIRYREATRSRHGSVPAHYVDYKDLQFTEVSRETDPFPVAMTDGGQPAECDDCPCCELGDHHRCRGHNCPQAHNW